MAQAGIKAKFDLTIIGSGIVGLATARQVLLRHPSLRVCVLEKEEDLALHQTKRNSGVVHCGIYYKKGSLKSRFCIRGSRLIKEYCEHKGLPYIQCGKMIIATRQDELPTLHKLYENAKSNKIEDVELISRDRVLEIQPGCTKAIEAIWSPRTAIVDWRQIALSYAKEFEDMGGTILKNFTVIKFKGENKSLVLENATNVADSVESKAVVNCAGVYSDYFARRTGNDEHPKVVPFKGNYFILDEKFAQSIKTNLYPVPNPKVPFLGVHITPRIDGSVLVGPTSLLTLGYEKYTSEPLRFIHLYHILYRSGLRKMLHNRDYITAGLTELHRRFSKRRVAQDVREFLPDIEAKHLVDTKFCGIRAQVIGKDGELVDDFLFESGVSSQFNRVLHLRNCPSPAATSSLAIAERVVSILEERLI